MELYDQNLIHHFLTSRFAERELDLFLHEHGHAVVLCPEMSPDNSSICCGAAVRFTFRQVNHYTSNGTFSGQSLWYLSFRKAWRGQEECGGKEKKCVRVEDCGLPSAWS